MGLMKVLEWTYHCECLDETTRDQRRLRRGSILSVFCAYWQDRRSHLSTELFHRKHETQAGADDFDHAINTRREKTAVCAGDSQTGKDLNYAYE